MDKIKNTFRTEFDKALDSTETWMIRFAVAIFIILIVYVVASTFLINRINKKDLEVKDFIADANSQISNIVNNTKIVNERTSQYDAMIQKINEMNEKLTQSYARKNILPNFLTEIMFNIPKDVQLLSIENTSGKAITIEAQSKKYEQLGYFVAKIKNEAILTEVTSTSGVKQGEFVVVTIQGNLSY